MQSLNILISGKVQGVFFRASTKAVADQLGVKGTVRNLADGSVEIMAESDDAIMRYFIDWCQEGPDEAVVSGIKITPTEFKNYRNFVILKR